MAGLIRKALCCFSVTQTRPLPSRSGFCGSKGLPWDLDGVGAGAAAGVSVTGASDFFCLTLRFLPMLPVLITRPSLPLRSAFDCEPFAVESSARLDESSVATAFSLPKQGYVAPHTSRQSSGRTTGTIRHLAGLLWSAQAMLGIGSQGMT